MITRSWKFDQILFLRFREKCRRRFPERLGTPQRADSSRFSYDNEILKVWSNSVPTFSRKVPPKISWKIRNPTENWFLRGLAMITRSWKFDQILFLLFREKCRRRFPKRLGTPQRADSSRCSYDNEILKVWSNSVPTFSRKVPPKIS